MVNIPCCFPRGEFRLVAVITKSQNSERYWYVEYVGMGGISVTRLLLHMGTHPQSLTANEKPAGSDGRRGRMADPSQMVAPPGLSEWTHGHTLGASSRPLDQPEKTKQNHLWVAGRWVRGQARHLRLDLETPAKLTNVFVFSKNRPTDAEPMRSQGRNLLALSKRRVQGGVREVLG